MNFPHREREPSSRLERSSLKLLMFSEKCAWPSVLLRDPALLSLFCFLDRFLRFKAIKVFPLIYFGNLDVIFFPFFLSKKPWVRMTTAFLNVYLYDKIFFRLLDQMLMWFSYIKKPYQFFFPAFEAYKSVKLFHFRLGTISRKMGDLSRAVTSIQGRIVSRFLCYTPWLFHSKYSTIPFIFSSLCTE